MEQVKSERTVEEIMSVAGMEVWDNDQAFILNVTAIEARAIYVGIMKLDMYDRRIT